MDAFSTKMECAYCPALPAYWKDDGSMVCGEHTNVDFVDLSVFGKRDLDPDLVSVHGKRGHEADVVDLSGIISLCDAGKKLSKQECGLCGEAIRRRAAFATCGQGHVVCKGCVVQYVEKTLMSRGTVWIDTIQCCVDSDCLDFFKGKDVSACLSKKTKDALAKRQMDASYLVAGGVDPSSQKYLDKNSKACPGCGIPISKAGGCDHTTCKMCRHEFWWTCHETCSYPWHGPGCSRGYATRAPGV